MKFKIKNDSLILQDEHDNEYQVTLDSDGYFIIDAINRPELVVYPQSETSIKLATNESI